MEKSLFDEVSEVIAKAPNFGYYNTTNLHNPELKECQEKAKTQDEIVLAFFQKYEGSNWSPDEVHRYLKLPRVPLTSIRRAISNLEHSGRLVKTGNQRIGSFGRKTNCWKIK